MNRKINDIILTCLPFLLILGAILTIFIFLNTVNVTFYEKLSLIISFSTIFVTIIAIICNYDVMKKNLKLSQKPYLTFSFSTELIGKTFNQDNIYYVVDLSAKNDKNKHDFEICGYNPTEKLILNLAICESGTTKINFFNKENVDNISEKSILFYKNLFKIKFNEEKFANNERTNRLFYILYQDIYGGTYVGILINIIEKTNKKCIIETKYFENGSKHFDEYIRKSKIHLDYKRIKNEYLKIVEQY